MRGLKDGWEVCHLREGLVKRDVSGWLSIGREREMGVRGRK